MNEAGAIFLAMQGCVYIYHVIWDRPGIAFDVGFEEDNKLGREFITEG